MSGIYEKAPVIERDAHGNVVLRMAPSQAGTIGWALMRSRATMDPSWRDLSHDLYEIEQDEDPKPGLYITINGFRVTP